MVSMATSKKTFAAKLKELRQRKNLTRSEAAAKLGIPQKTLRNWEQDAAKPAPYFQRMVLRLLEAE